MARTAYFVPNATILKVERPGAIDRYGQGQLETVYRDIRGRLSKRTIHVRSSDGDVISLDGSVMLDQRFVLQSGDSITFSDASTWKIFGVEESCGIQGNILFRTYTLTKQR